uniref:Uncharacterized protein n=1 Tax=Arundo donax TaxID=35708 RepID=A0A0A9V0B4_ARUDO
MLILKLPHCQFPEQDAFIITSEPSNKQVPGHLQAITVSESGDNTIYQPGAIT